MQISNPQAPTAMIIVNPAFNNAIKISNLNAPIAIILMNKNSATAMRVGS